MTLRLKHNVASVNSLRHLSQAHQSLTSSLEKLSSGLKINRGVDGPANLMFSENLRGQIAGLEQALSNSEVSMSVVQTAEGALAEVSNVLIEMRQLALAAANYGANDFSTLAALQSELNHALKSIDRISSNTQFGNKFLLDGSRGISGVASGEGLEYLGANVETKSSPVQGYAVEVLSLPQRALFQAKLSDDQASNLQLSLEEKGGNLINVVHSQGDTAAAFAARLQRSIDSAEMHLDIGYDRESEQLLIQHRDYGQDNGFTITTPELGLLKNGKHEQRFSGSDIKGRIHGEVAVGKATTLTGKAGNRNTDGLSVSYSGKKTGNVGSVSVLQNALIFQTGARPADQVKLAIDSTHTSHLSRGIENSSGFANLSDVSVFSSQEAADAIRLVDKAIVEVAGVRGELGSVQSHALETSKSTLNVAIENLLAADSNVRDADMAYELAEFTKYQIMTAASAAATAQANHINSRTLETLLDVPRL